MHHSENRTEFHLLSKWLSERWGRNWLAGILSHIVTSSLRWLHYYMRPCSVLFHLGEKQKSPPFLNILTLNPGTALLFTSCQWDLPIQSQCDARDAGKCNSFPGCSVCVIWYLVAPLAYTTTYAYILPMQPVKETKCPHIFWGVSQGNGKPPLDANNSSTQKKGRRTCGRELATSTADSKFKLNSRSSTQCLVEWEVLEHTPHVPSIFCRTSAPDLE